MTANILLVSCLGASSCSALISAWRTGALLAGCAVEHLVWGTSTPELCSSCLSCQLSEQCSQADHVALAAQRLLAADAVAFFVDVKTAGEDSPILPLLRACQKDIATWKTPRYLYVVNAADGGCREAGRGGDSTSSGRNSVHRLHMAEPTCLRNGDVTNVPGSLSGEAASAPGSLSDAAASALDLRSGSVASIPLSWSQVAVVDTDNPAMAERMQSWGRQVAESLLAH